MNKAQLIDAMAKNGVTKTDADAAVAIITDVITKELACGGEVTLPGIGKLSVTKRAAREGRNPATGEAIKIAAKKAVKFSAAKALKDAVNTPPAKKGKK